MSGLPGQFSRIPHESPTNGHLKRGLKNAYPEANNFHFFSDQLGTDEWKAIKILAQAGKTVTIETKNINNNG